MSTDKPEAPRRWVVSPEDLPELAKKRRVRLLDARRSALHARSHADDALSLPLTKLLLWSGQSARFPPEGEVRDLMDAIGASSKEWIVLYDDHQGLHASRAAWTLEHSGYRNVSVLDTDFSKLGNVNLTSSPPEDEQTASPPKKPMGDTMVTMEELLTMLSKGGVKMIDSREPGLFPLGHIPGAHSLPWYQLSGHGKNFLGPEEILTYIGKLQLDGKKTVVYCGSALNSAHTYVALKWAGLKNVRLYAATYGDWVTNGGPVERGWQTPKPEAEPAS